MEHEKRPINLDYEAADISLDEMHQFTIEQPRAATADKLLAAYSYLGWRLSVLKEKDEAQRPVLLSKQAILEAEILRRMGG